MKAPTKRRAQFFERESRRMERFHERFLELEVELDLFQRRLAGFLFWDYMRVEVHDAVARGMGLGGSKHDPVDRSPLGYLRELPSIARSLMFHDPFRQAPVDYLFIGHPRRKREADGTWWDPYSDPLIDALAAPAAADAADAADATDATDAPARRTLLVERPFHNRHCRPAHTAAIAHLDALALRAALARRRRRFEFTTEAKSFLAGFQKRLEAEFGVAVPVAEMTARRMAVRASQLPLFRKLLKKLEPKVVFLVVSYGNEIPIEACKELGIPTVELQHGVISDRHLGYHYRHEKARKRLFPDWLFLFGEFWRDAAAFPIPPERVRSVGWAYLERRRLAQRRIERKQQVLFLSQKTIGASLSRMAAELAKTPGVEHEVVYKLHPGEQRSWRKDYPWLTEAKVRVVDGDVPHLYELLAESTVQVGVYSTALYEGLVFGLETLIVRLPGADAMQRLIELSGQSRWVDDTRSLAAALRTSPGFHDETETYFRPDAVDNFKEAVLAILAGRGTG